MNRRLIVNGIILLMHILNYKIATRYLQQQKTKKNYLLLWVSAFYKYFQNFDYIRGFTYELASIQPKKQIWRMLNTIHQNEKYGFN